jgi:hypothetical protein
MTLTTSNKLHNPSIISLFAVLAALFSIGLVSACSGTQTSQPNTAQNNTGTLPAAQAPATSAAGAAGPNSNAPAEVVSAPPPLAGGASPGQEHLAGIGSATVVTIHGKIVSVNRPKKLVTLEGPRGRQVTIHVYNPYNVAEAKAGEPFVAKFYEIVTIVKKKPSTSVKKKPSTSIPPASLVEGIVSAVPGQTPGAAFGSQLQVVATIDAINEDGKTVALKGPDGVVETVKVANPANLKHVKVGDQIVITLSNVVAITLEKESGAWRFFPERRVLLDVLDDDLNVVAKLGIQTSSAALLLAHAGDIKRPMPNSGGSPQHGGSTVAADRSFTNILKGYNKEGVAAVWQLDCGKNLWNRPKSTGGEECCGKQQRNQKQNVKWQISQKTIKKENHR